MADVRRVVIDLSQPADRLAINHAVGGDGFRNAQVEIVVVLDYDGAGVLIHFGSDAEGWDLLPLGTEYELCPPETTGIFYTLSNPTGGQLVLGVSFAGGVVNA